MGSTPTQCWIPNTRWELKQCNLWPTQPYATHKQLHNLTRSQPIFEGTVARRKHAMLHLPSAAEGFHRSHLILSLHLALSKQQKSVHMVMRSSEHVSQFQLNNAGAWERSFMQQCSCAAPAHHMNPVSNQPSPTNTSFQRQVALQWASCHPPPATISATTYAPR